MIAAFAVAAAMLAADPVDVAPTDWVVPAWRVHVYANEDLDPDALGRLARPGVVLWLSTRSNLIRASVLARLPRFREAYVRLRPPIERSQWHALEAAPRAGVWLEGSDALPQVQPGLGARPLAVDIRGELSDAVADALRGAKLQRLRWVAVHAPTLDAWARFVQLPGARTVAWEWPAIPDGGACPLPPGVPGLSVSSPDVAKLCGWGLRLPVTSLLTPEALRALFIAHPSLELELEAQTEAQAAQARAWLDQLP